MGLVASTRRTRRLLAIAPLAWVLGAVPATAVARTGLTRAPDSGSVIGTSGGSGTSTATSTSTSTSTTTTPTPTPVVKLATALTASGDGISITIAGSGATKHPLTISGTAPETAAGSRIAIETAPTSSHSWTQVATALIAPTGAFAAVWVPSSSGEVAIRAVLSGGLTSALVQTETGDNGAGALPASGTTTTASTTVTTSALLIPIFKSAIATMYGPGLWNRHTFCGERLRKTTLGVASRTLKCGTKVEISFKGREITVPVIDRGPFANNATWDLTWATGKALGMKATSTIGTLT
jgi:rare lipoprotein A